VLGSLTKSLVPGTGIILSGNNCAKNGACFVQENSGNEFMSKPVNAAIIGLGRWGELLVSSVDDSEQINFTAAVTRTPANAEDFCAARGMSLSSDLADVLEDDNIDALVIATPHTQHFDQLMAAANAGKHVFCEKPWTLDADQAGTSIRALRDAGLKIAIGHNRRFAPNSQAMKKILIDGDLGNPIHIDGHFSANLVPSEGRWRDNRDESPAGGMTSMGIHALDMFINMFGRVSNVNVQSKRVASAIDVDDSTLVRLNFKNGCTGHLTTISATNMLWRISAYCTGGWVEIRDQDRIEVSSIAEGNSSDSWPDYSLPAMPSIGHALEAFAGDVAGGPAYPISPDDIEHATRVLAAIIASAETGETVTPG
jgi:predicted dehydrogenase